MGELNPEPPEYIPQHVNESYKFLTKLTENVMVDKSVAIQNEKNF
jgi:hypothetical protein